MAMLTCIANAQASGGSFSINGLRHKITAVTGITFSRSGFWKKLASQKLVTQLKLILKDVMQEFMPLTFNNMGLMKILGVSDILLIDSTSCSLPNRAKLERYPRKTLLP